MSKRMDVLEILIETCQNLLKKIIFGFKKRRRVIENGLKQVKLANNFGFPVSFER